MFAGSLDALTEYVSITCLPHENESLNKESKSKLKNLIRSVHSVSLFFWLFCQISLCDFFFELTKPTSHYLICTHVFVSENYYKKN